MDKDTIIINSKLGKHLDKIKHTETNLLLFNNQKIPLISKIIIGRNRSNQIAIDNNLVSRKHALIQKIRNVYYIKDLNSTNGTFINKKKVPTDKYVKINSGDIITIGKSNFIFK